MLVILVVAMAAAAGRYLILATKQRANAQAIFAMFVLAIPVLLVIAVSSLRLLLEWWDRRHEPPE